MPARSAISPIVRSLKFFSPASASTASDKAARVFVIRASGISNPRPEWRLIAKPVSDSYDPTWIINWCPMVDAHIVPPTTNCPYHQGGDERKSALPPAAAPGVIVVEKLGLARQILRSDRVRQAGFRAELLERFGRKEHAPVLYQAGEVHQKQRSAIARFFAPKIVSGRYRVLMER